MLKIDFIEEIRTAWDNKKVPQTFFHNSPCSQKYDLTGLIPYHWQSCISRFYHTIKSVLMKISNGNLDLQVPVAVAKFSDLVEILTGLVGRCIVFRFVNCVFARIFAKSCRLWCHKIAKCRVAVANGTESNELNGIFVNKGNCGKRFGVPLYSLK